MKKANKTNKTKKSKRGEKSGKSSEQSNKSKRKATTKTASPREDTASPSYEVTYIAVDEIKVPGGRRQLSPGTMASLKDSIAVIGLRSPLTVCKINGVTRLVGGLHRLGSEGPRLEDGAGRAHRGQREGGAPLGNLRELRSRCS
jgi:hypothetical protein